MTPGESLLHRFDLVDSPVAIRCVNGYGARCGCGGKSVVHLCGGHPVNPENSTFLCGECCAQAFTAFMLSRPDQPHYWPGDEERDEPYEDPRRAS